MSRATLSNADYNRALIRAARKFSRFSKRACIRASNKGNRELHRYCRLTTWSICK